MVSFSSSQPKLGYLKTMQDERWHCCRKDIIECNGVPRSKWVTSIVILHDASIIAVAWDVYHNMSFDLLIGSNSLLGDDRMAVQIIDMLSKDSTTLDWISSLRAWNITHVILDVVSLHDHNKTTSYIEAMKVAYYKKCTRMCEYEYDARPRLLMKTKKNDQFFIVWKKYSKTNPGKLFKWGFFKKKGHFVYHFAI